MAWRWTGSSHCLNQWLHTSLTVFFMPQCVNNKQNERKQIFGIFLGYVSILVPAGGLFLEASLKSYPLKFHTKYLTNTPKDMILYKVEILRARRFKSSYAIMRHSANVIPYPDGVYTPTWSVHSKATLLPLPLECTLQPHSEYHRCTLGCHSMDFVKSLTNRNTPERHFKCTPDGVYTPLPLL